MASPCIGVCVMDGDLCAGCGRTLDEIARWVSMSEAERGVVLVETRARKAGGSVSIPPDAPSTMGPQSHE